MCSRCRRAGVRVGGAKAGAGIRSVWACLETDVVIDLSRAGCRGFRNGYSGCPRGPYVQICPSFPTLPRNPANCSVSASSYHSTIVP
eukprot:2392522-Pyramimonas_sp.AAC.2